MIENLQGNPWLGMAIVAAALVFAIGALQFVQRVSSLPPEAIRKSFHFASSVVALALPWLFATPWPVVAMGGVSLLVFLAMRVVPALRAGPGQVLQAVPRESAGEFWFILGVVAIFLLAGDDIVVYSVGILVLAVADTAAALVGIFYGKHKFEVPGGVKSAEGSFALLLVAFLCMHVPLLLFTDVGRAESLLIGLNVALLLMLAEADTSRGLDNFALPVMVVVLLDVFMDNSVAALVGDFVAILALGLFIFAFRNRTTLSTDALIGVALGGFICWLFGDWQWLVAPLFMLATYTLLIGRPRLVESRAFHADVLLAIVALPITLVTLYEPLRYDVLYLMYVASWCANLAVIGTLHRQLEHREQPVRRFALANTVKSLVIMVPALGVAWPVEPKQAAATILAVPAALVVFSWVGGTLKDQPTQPGRWWSVTASVSLGVLGSFGVLEVGGVLLK